MMFLGNPSKRLKYHRLLLSSLAALIGMVGCQRVTPAEERVIGTWEFTGLDATGRVVFRRDHKVVDLFTDGDGPNARWIATFWGKWRLEGNEIVTDEETLVGDYATSTRRLGRIPISEFEQNRLVRADGRGDFYRVHPDLEQQYSQLLSVFYFVMSVVGLATGIYGIRTSRFRKEFTWLAVAAAFAMGWSTLTLVAELAQTGILILSPSVSGRLQVLTEILPVICLVVFTTAFIKLAFSSRDKAPATTS